MNLLLGSDERLSPPTKEEVGRDYQIITGIRVLRLSSQLRRLLQLSLREIQDMSIDVKGKDADIDITQLRLFTVIEGVVDAAGAPMFKNKGAYMSKFKVST